MHKVYSVFRIVWRELARVEWWTGRLRPRYEDPTETLRTP